MSARGVCTKAFITTQRSSSFMYRQMNLVLDAASRESRTHYRILFWFLDAFSGWLMGCPVYFAFTGVGSEPWPGTSNHQCCIMTSECGISSANPQSSYCINRRPKKTGCLRLPVFFLGLLLRVTMLFSSATVFYWITSWVIFFIDHRLWFCIFGSMNVFFF